MNTVRFSFEKLDVWQKAVQFAKIAINLTENINSRSKHYRLIEQLESAATSVALNIAEGSGRYSAKEFIRFLYVARGSLYETVALVVIFRDNNWISCNEYDNIIQLSGFLGRMLSGLINSLKPNNHEL